MSGWAPSGLRTIPGRATNAALGAGGECAGDVPRVRGNEPHLANGHPERLRYREIGRGSRLQRTRAVRQDDRVENVAKTRVAHLRLCDINGGWSGRRA
jgi:hypothetical protein